MSNEDSVMRSWEQWYTTPPDEPEEICECGNEAEYDIHNEPFCSVCIDRFRYIPHNEVRCSVCDELIEEGYLIDGDPYCGDCFESVFHM